jgi:formylglycine-generating enzyme required for sulfatase activity
MINQPQAVSANTILPPPFDWCDIPAGEVTLDHLGGYLVEATTFPIVAFTLAQYPITNAQYQVFVDAADGYADSSWWAYSNAAQAWRAENPAPRQSFGEADHPRTHVSWYEAVAFCQWLSEKTGDTIRLPEETEWQRAAQGNDKRTYPWGEEWEAQRCKNNTESQGIGTSSVREYAGSGDSPFGVTDMVGNVWEWSSTRWTTGSNSLNTDQVRVTRGGSWFDNSARYYRVNFRNSWNPDIASDCIGFRIVRQ